MGKHGAHRAPLHQQGIGNQQQQLAPSPPPPFNQPYSPSTPSTAPHSSTQNSLILRKQQQHGPSPAGL